MSAVIGIIHHRAAEPIWAWPNPQLALGPDQAVFFLRKRDQALTRVEVSGADVRTVRFETGSEGFVVNRDFGVRLHLPCDFDGPTAGEIDAEVRVRLLDDAAEWPRRLPQMAALPAGGNGGGPEEALGALVAALFEAELAAFASGRTFDEFSRRLNDPLLVREAEARLRRAMARWSEEGIVALLAVHFLGLQSPEAECRRRMLAEHERRERDHAQRLLQVRHAGELAAAERQQRLAAPDEARWRLFEPGDLLPAGARPPRLLKESAAPFEAIVSGQHLQVLVRPGRAGYIYVLALGPYRTQAGVEYRWMRLFGNDGRSDLVARAPRPRGNRLECGESLLFPGDVGAAELFQQYLTTDAAPGWETLVVAITPEALPEPGCGQGLPEPAGCAADFRAFQDQLNRGLQSIFGTDASLYLFQFFHS